MEFNNTSKSIKLLSIVVPMYNSEKWLPKCIESLLHQDITPEEYEIILVDDGSPDGCRAMAENYAARYSNILVLIRPNGGTSAARNTGIRAATGKYLCFVDPDDYVKENSFRDILFKMEDDDLDVLRFGYKEVDEDGVETQSVKHPAAIDYSTEIMDGPTFMAKRLGVSCFVWTYLFKTALIQDNKIYFGERVYYDDTPWLPLVLRKAKRVDSINVKRHYYLIRMDSLVRAKEITSIHKKIDGQRYLIKELLRQKNEIGSSPAVSWYKMMISHCVLTLLSFVGAYDYKNREEYFHELRDLRVFPLTFWRSSLRNCVKLAIVNISPTLYCRYCNLR